MIVNVNPYDTGYDENAHVMRFSAVAREIQTTAQNKVTFPGLGIKRQISSQFSALKHAVSGPMKVKVTVPVLGKVDETVDTTRLAMDRESQGFIMVEEELEVVEEDDEESEDERDWFVEHLLERLKEANTKVGLFRINQNQADQRLALRIRNAQCLHRSGGSRGSCTRTGRDYPANAC